MVGHVILPQCRAARALRRLGDRLLVRAGLDPDDVQATTGRTQSYALLMALGVALVVVGVILALRRLQ